MQTLLLVGDEVLMDHVNQMKMRTSTRTPIAPSTGSFNCYQQDVSQHCSSALCEHVQSPLYRYVKGGSCQ